MCKKIIMSTLLIMSMLLFSCGQNATDNTTKGNTTGGEVMQNEDNKIDLLTSSRDESTNANFMWVGTFPLIWDELKQKYIGDDVVFDDGAAKTIVENLNTEPFDKTEINENSYYLKSSYKINEALKKEIETALKEKFNETSDILNDFDFSDQDNALFLYAMLKKDFKFRQAFTKLSKDKFNGGTKDVEYFGIDKNSDKSLKDNVSVLFYKDPNEYAVVLATESEDEVILYRTDKKMTLANYFEELNANEDYDDFYSEDTLKIPVIKLNEKKEFKELENHTINHTNLSISKALETVKFNMDEKGVYLKSEAGMMIMKASLMEEKPEPRNYNFDKGFTLFLKERDAEMPYFMLRVENDSIFE